MLFPTLSRVVPSRPTLLRVLARSTCLDFLNRSERDYLDPDWARDAIAREETRGVTKRSAIRARVRVAARLRASPDGNC